MNPSETRKLGNSGVELTQLGFGGEAPILVRTKEGKVFAIAGVGTMPKLATADFFRSHRLTPRRAPRRFDNASSSETYSPRSKTHFFVPGRDSYHPVSNARALECSM